MRHLTPHQLSLLKFYAQEIGQLATYQFIEDEKISSRVEAAAIKSLMDKILDLAYTYEKHRKVVLGEAAYHGDIIKLQLMIDELLEKSGYCELDKEES